jgi:hypothetical protein
MQIKTTEQLAARLEELGACKAALFEVRQSPSILFFWNRLKNEQWLHWLSHRLNCFEEYNFDMEAYYQEFCRRPDLGDSLEQSRHLHYEYVTKPAKAAFPLEFWLRKLEE